MKDNLSEAELGYIAAIIDGEGCITIQKTHQPRREGLYYRRLVVEISNTSYELMDWLQARLGGNITDRDKGGNRKIQYRLMLTSNNAYTLLKAVGKYFVIKGAQANWGIMFYELAKERQLSVGGEFARFSELSQDDINREEFIKEQISKLNQKGVY